MIRVDNLSHKYNGALAATLRNINLQIREGEYVALIGPNGSGKTTLIRHLNALIMPQTGEVMVDGLTCRKSSHHAEIRRNVGMVFQNPDNQIVGMTVEEDVAFGPGNLNLPPQEIQRRVNDSLQMVGLMGLEKRIPFNLSGGEKQLLALAGLLAVNPKYIVLDETTASLDPAAKAKVLAILEQLRARQISIIHVTHNMEEAALAERVIMMKDGEIITAGPPGEVLTDVDRLRSLGLAPPPMVELLSRLNIADKTIPPGILTVEEAADFINRTLTRTVMSPDRLEVGEVEGCV